MAYGLSNGHVTPKGAVRQYDQLSYRQLGFLFTVQCSEHICGPLRVLRIPPRNYDR